MHEFAHQLDQIDGAADGAPTLGQGEERGQRRQLYRSWALVFSRDFECLQKKGSQGQKDRDRPLRRNESSGVFRDSHRGLLRETTAIEKEKAGAL